MTANLFRLEVQLQVEGVHIPGIDEMIDGFFSVGSLLLWEDGFSFRLAWHDHGTVLPPHITTIQPPLLSSSLFLYNPLLSTTTILRSTSLGTREKKKGPTPQGLVFCETKRVLFQYFVPPLIKTDTQGLMLQCP
jgi:hypothetical protein